MFKPLTKVPYGTSHLEHDESELRAKLEQHPELLTKNDILWLRRLLEVRLRREGKTISEIKAALAELHEELRPLWYQRDQHLRARRSNRAQIQAPVGAAEWRTPTNKKKQRRRKAIVLGESG